VHEIVKSFVCDGGLDVLGILPGGTATGCFKELGELRPRHLLVGEPAAAASALKEVEHLVVSDCQLLGVVLTDVVFAVCVGIEANGTFGADRKVMSAVEAGGRLIS